MLTMLFFQKTSLWSMMADHSLWSVLSSPGHAGFGSKQPTTVRRWTRISSQAFKLFQTGFVHPSRRFQSTPTPANFHSLSHRLIQHSLIRFDQTLLSNKANPSPTALASSPTFRSSELMQKLTTLDFSWDTDPILGKYSENPM